MSSSIHTTNNSSTDEIRITLLCHSDSTQHDFSLSSATPVRVFIEMVLERLAQTDHTGRMSRLRECYEPVLEVVEASHERELSSNQTLAEAGVTDNSICQIAARPLKEKLMFCRHSGQ